MPKPRKPARKTLIKALDNLAKLVAKERDKWICQKCGKEVHGKSAHGSHVIPVARGHRLRWENTNIKCLCSYCHRRFWHSNPVEAGEWFKAKFPKRWAAIESMLGDKKRFSTAELEELRQDLSRKLKRLRSR